MAADDLLQYYKRELSYLRTQGADFARRYPKIASKLALHGTESLDPHTERLVEATAFLAARVHRDLDQEFPHVASSLLDNVCPTLVQPVPSMTVAQFELDPTQGKVTAGFAVPRHTALQARTEGGDVCRFRTAWDTVLWPLTISRAAFGDDATLRLTLECAPGTDFAELEIDTLRLHLNGDWMTTMPLYELLVSGVADVSVRAEGRAHALPLPARAWREVGYGEADDVLPRPANAQPAYALMQEYFAFPRKFHFFDLHHLRGRLGTGRSCEIVLHLSRAPRGLGMLRATHFALGCTPIVNLFSQTSEPIVVDHRHYEYRLVADQRRESITEIHSIVSVVASDPSLERTATVPCFSAIDHGDAGGGAAFWSARREHSLRENVQGTDTFLSFVDASNTQADPGAPVIYANVLCTNRRLAEQVPVGARLLVEKVSQNARVRCLYEPTAQRSPALGSETLWRLISLLTLNYHSLVSGATGRAQLQEMLRLFASEGTREQDQIRGIRSVEARGVTAHVGGEAWRGYCRGTEVTVEFDPEAFVGGSPLLMGAVLARFFALYTSVNSFVRLVVRRGDEIWKQWEPMTGCQQLL
ncbi:type VI secretion system baseplate subunit TssF [Paraburkholderia acidisoli]|uniref:Type VI secretion system baseplate subunit TssF n=1 Tax=Paraburkholderia acidisoli TaxID=2571748 RepID=A0A7Z2JIZ7_9BURK|nr:type VI secretion system baseplate subunit TssF [Paraburkholderia acidisoli]QGZ64854.1 type VI secretion system baseplate subunit TssF [Paraburkholderia acidisoli]